mmetsp:Transcript_19377/g.42810  ORF Transcript_19377/g.42810 Transcript_19377/m.42810 type:complete len:92 (-) Transcript_19377:258-533(-)
MQVSETVFYQALSQAHVELPEGSFLQLPHHQSLGLKRPFRFVFVPPLFDLLWEHYEWYWKSLLAMLQKSLPVAAVVPGNWPLKQLELELRH